MTHSAQSTAYDVVKKYHHAWTGGDVKTAMGYVADDVTCRAPGMDIDGKDAYRKFITGFAPALTGIGDIAEFTDGTASRCSTTRRQRRPPRLPPPNSSPSKAGGSARAC